MSENIDTYNSAEQQFIAEIRRIVDVARRNAYRAINIMQVISNWLVGQRIVEQNQQTLSAKSVAYTIPVYPQLSWSHYERLMRVEEEKARLWYLKEAAQQMWG